MAMSDPGIVPQQKWQPKNGADNRQAIIKAINYDTGAVRIQWIPTDYQYPTTELSLTDFVERFRRVAG